MLMMTGSFAQNEKKVNEISGRQVGEQAPLFSAHDAANEIFSLKTELAKNPAVLIFYRGFWCPICNAHLGKLQDSLQLIRDEGAQVIAVSPEKPEYLNKMANQTGAQFTLLYDEGYRIANAYDVTFKPTMSQLVIYNVGLGAHLKETHSDESQRLPIPATFIINQQGKIIWRQFDPNYKNRSSVKDIIEALRKEKSGITGDR